MPESHWIARCVEQLDDFLSSKIVSTWIPREVIDVLYITRNDLIRQWDICRGSEQLLARQFETGQIAQ
jgi:hypothetical protein